MHFYIYVDTTGCWSEVGSGGGEQFLNIQDENDATCSLHGIIQHELMHALGFMHEQSRPDRDTFVTINRDNVEASALGNFDKMAYSAWRSNGFDSPYDYGSVMHYSSVAFSKNGGNTITQLQSGPTIGQREGLSAQDIIQLNRLYACPSSTTSVPLDGNQCMSAPCLNGGVCADLIASFTCSCVSGFVGDLCETLDTRNGPASLYINLQSAAVVTGWLRSTSRPYVIITVVPVDTLDGVVTRYSSSLRLRATSGGLFRWDTQVVITSGGWKSFTLMIVDSSNRRKRFPKIRTFLPPPSRQREYYSYIGDDSLSGLSFQFSHVIL